MHRWDNAQGAYDAIKGEGTVKVEIKDLVIERIVAGTSSMPSLTFGFIQAALACRDGAVTVVPGAGFAQKSAGLSLPPLQPGTPLTFKLVGPIMNARVAL